MARQNPAKIKMAELMLAGTPCAEAIEQAGVWISPSGAYWFVTQYCLRGEEALEDRRHGRAHKLVGEIKTWLVEACRQRPEVTSRELQGMVWERYAVRVSIGYLNQVRHAHGLSRPKKKPV